jgi:hypothetical protein
MFFVLCCAKMLLLINSKRIRKADFMMRWW